MILYAFHKWSFLKTTEVVSWLSSRSLLYRYTCTIHCYVLFLYFSVKIYTNKIMLKLTEVVRQNVPQVLQVASTWLAFYSHNRLTQFFRLFMCNIFVNLLFVIVLFMQKKQFIFVQKSKVFIFRINLYHSTGWQTNIFSWFWSENWLWHFLANGLICVKHQNLFGKNKKKLFQTLSSAENFTQHVKC